MKTKNLFLRRPRALVHVVLALCASALPAVAARAAGKAEIVDVRRIWDAGAHNAFTDLIRWNDRWWCTFREAEAHVGGDGAIQILTSLDGTKWESAARLTEKGIDLRDPKLSVMPSGKLMLNCGDSVYEGRTLKGKRSRAMFSADGRNWTRPEPILNEGDWLWRATWHDGVAYGTVYRAAGSSSQPGPEWSLAVFRSTDGLKWELVKELEVTGRPNEATLRFQPDGEMIAMVRRETGNRMGVVGRARPPYQQWTWSESNYRFGGPDFIVLPDGRWIAGTRDYTGTKHNSTAGSRTIVAEMRLDGHLTPLVTLPSDGDTSYPGMVWHDGLLWFSYYSSHEGKTAIYLARIRIDPR